MLPIVDLDETRGTLGSLKKHDKNSIQFHQQLGKSTIIVDVLEVTVVVFLWVNQILLHCIQIYLRNLTKVRWKLETYILIFQIQK
jgi:hypothetical protein